MTVPARFVRHASGAVSLIPDGARFAERLRDYFDYLCSASAYYRGLVEQCGIPAATDPVGLLGALPVTSKETYRSVLLEEALSSANGANLVTDFSSGSTAEPVMRVCRPADDLCEQEVTEEVFRRAGMEPGDRFVCMDVGAAEIYDFYFRAARNLGVHEVQFLHLTTDWAGSVRPLGALKPTILLSTPSLLARAWPPLRALWDRESCPVKTLIMMGEATDPQFRDAIRAAWGCRVVSFYGTTEIGGFAGECHLGDGHHFRPDLVVPTVEAPRAFDGDQVEGEVYFTSTHIHTQSVVKYQVGDVARLSTVPCPCGEITPRLWFLERCEDAFVMAGEKFSHAMFLAAFRDVAPGLGLMTLEIADLEGGDGKVRLTFTLPQQYRAHEAALLDLLRDGIFELDSLYRYGLVDFELVFAAADENKGRKLRRVIDHRLC